MSTKETDEYDKQFNLELARRLRLIAQSLPKKSYVRLILSLSAERLEALYA